MVDAVQLARAAIEAFIKSLTEPVQVVPAMDLFDSALNTVKKKGPKVRRRFTPQPSSFSAILLGLRC